jgi:RimJ/RimL family protein N-acetyltransferase
MGALDDWPLAPILRTQRLSLEPLRVDHADEMAPLLDDPRLFTFIGGSPSTLEELRHRYERQVTTWSLDGHERWLNWIVRDLGCGQAIGGMQATITVDDDTVLGELAWIVGARHQRRGYALEAARAMAVWLREQGARTLLAEIHPHHRASMAVARSLGLKPSDHVLESGEIRWTGDERQPDE